MSHTTYRSSRKTLAYVLALCAGVSLVAYGYFSGYSYWAKTERLTTKQEQIQATQEIIESKWSEKDFIKLALARHIQNTQEQIARSEHIQTLISIIQAIQDSSFIGSNVIRLSDLQVTSEQISLQGEVSNLILLYHSLPERGYTSLLDRFNELDFVQQVAIQEYERVGDLIQFTLTADISLQHAQQ